MREILGDALIAVLAVLVVAGLAGLWLEWTVIQRLTGL